MKLSEIRKDADYFTSKAGDLCRNLSFAGLGLIWIFKHEINGEISIPKELYLPSLFLIISLSIDLLQFALQSMYWSWFYRKKREEMIKANRSNEDEEEANENESVNNIPYLFWLLKVLALICGYYFIYQYIITKI